MFKCRMCFLVIPMQRGLKNLESLSTKTWRIIDEDLYREQAKWKKDELLTRFWTIDGKIFVKTSPSGDPVRIFSDYDFDNL